MKFFFPISHVIPEDNIEEVKIENIFIVPRKWDVTFYDLATLGAKHRLKMPYELLNVYLKYCNLEVCLEASSFEKAIVQYNCFRALLYVHGITPYISPCVMSHSLNQIAGINLRDSDWQVSEFDELNEGITSKDTKVEAWPLDLTLKSHSLAGHSAKVLSKHVLINSAYTCLRILDKYTSQSEIKNLVDGIVASPKIELLSQSLLHIWTVIESLFPSVNSELSFRLSLYVSHLFPFGNKETFEKVKKSYHVRSRVSHGSPKTPTYEEWKDAWDILCLVSNVVLNEGGMPSEDSIIDRVIFPNFCGHVVKQPY